MKYRMKKRMADKACMLLSWCADLLFPPRCVFCGEIVPPGEKVCRRCTSEILPSGEVFCVSVPVGNTQILCTYLFPYEGKVRDSILNFKFHGQKRNALYYAEKLAAQSAVAFPRLKFDAVTCVPLTRDREHERGYNQSELIARPLAEALEIPFFPCLKKTGKNKVQHFLNREERLRNVHGIYALSEKNDISGKKILLVDDILTTGSTMGECAFVLLQGGAASVRGAVIAKAGLESG